MLEEKKGSRYVASVNKTNVTSGLCKLSNKMSAQRVDNIRSLLLRAWRERWSDMQWGIAIKKVLPSGGNGDNYNLSELILQQALVGSSPNMLVLSYLKHAVSSQLVSYASVIKSILRVEDVGRLYCIKSLLEFVESFAKNICLKGVYEDSLGLGKALLHLLLWLLQIMHKSVQRLQDARQNTEYSSLLGQAANILRLLLQDQATAALVYVGRQDETETFREIEQTEANVRGTGGQLQSSVLSDDLRMKLDNSLKLLNRLQHMSAEPHGLIDVSHQALNITVNVMITIEAVLNPTNEAQSFVDQLIIVENGQSLTRPRLFCELLRTCMMGLVDAAGNQDELKWAAFTYLKLPQILTKLVQHSSTRDKLQELEQGLEMLMTYTPLLDLADTKCSCDCLHFLLGELFNKYALITEAQVKRFRNRRCVESRQTEIQKQKSTEQHSGTQQPSPSLILRAEPTVTTILKTLDSDYSKNQDALLGVLCHMMSGKSFELILAAAAATGKLQNFATKLIKFNEFAKHTSGEGGKVANTRALMFDISFLMLCHITQSYGTDILAATGESSNSFFAQWAVRCLPEEGRYKSLETHMQADPNKVEVLLSQFNPGGELKMQMTRWHEVCHNTPYAIMEVLFAWEHDALTAEQVKTVLDNVKKRMCCLPVVVSAWLCSYITTINEEVRQKPLNMLEQLIAVVPPEPANQYYNERSHLMQIVLKKMVTDILPSHAINDNYHMPSAVPAYHVLMESFRGVLHQGSIDLKSMHRMEHLLNVGGEQWFCEHLVREVLTHTRPEELSKGISLVFALFHMEMEPLTLCLLHHTVPALIQSVNSRLGLLSDPRGRSLAQLCVLCITVTHHMKQSPKEFHTVGRKRRRSLRTDLEFDDLDDSVDDGKPSKLRKLPVSGEELTLDAEGFNLDLLSSREEVEPVPVYDTKDPLNRALMSLFRLFCTIVSHNIVSPRTGFVMSFVEEAVRLGTQDARFILQFMPMNMVSQLMKCMPSTFSTDLILSICDLSSTVGRRVAAKAIAQHAKYQKSNTCWKSQPVRSITRESIDTIKMAAWKGETK